MRSWWVFKHQQLDPSKTAFSLESTADSVLALRICAQVSVYSLDAATSTAIVRKTNKGSKTEYLLSEFGSI